MRGWSFHVGGVLCLVAVAACAHAGHDSLPPTSASASYGIVRHDVRMLQGSRTYPTTSIIYAGTAQTIPAHLTSPNAIAFDSDDGDLYVLDFSLTPYEPDILRVVPSTGATTLFVTLPLVSANGLAYDHANKTFYVTSRLNAAYTPAILAVSGNGAISTLAGGQSSGFTDGTGAAASFNDPSAIAYDSHDGALYVTDTNRIRRVTSGVVTTTTTAIGYASDSYANFGITYNAYDGMLYVLETAKNIVDRVTPSGTVTAIAGACLGYQCDPLQRNGHGTSAFFAAPSGIVANPADGSLYVADYGNNSIRKIDRGFNVTTLAGNGVNQNVDGAGLNAEFDGPLALALRAGSSPSLYALDFDYSGGGTKALRSATINGSAPPPLNTPITLYETVTPDSYPFAIDWHASTPSSSVLWYSEITRRVAQITTSGVSTEFSVPTVSAGNAGLYDIALGSDGSPWMWGFDNAQLQITRRAAAGTYTTYLPNNVMNENPVDQLAYGPDGNVWFTGTSPAGSANLTVGYVASGKVVQYATSFGSTTTTTSRSMAFDSSGTVWIATFGTGLVHMTRTGNVLATYNYPADYVTKGPDGNIWFTQSDAIGTVKPTGGIIEVYQLYQPVPGCSAPCTRGVTALTTGPDGALWFVESAAGAIGRMTTDGVLTEYPVYAARRHPNDLSAGPDGNIWFVDSGAQKIGRLRIH